MSTKMHNVGHLRPYPAFHVGNLLDANKECHMTLCIQIHTFRWQWRILSKGCASVTRDIMWCKEHLHEKFWSDKCTTRFRWIQMQLNMNPFSQAEIPLLIYHFYQVTVDLSTGECVHFILARTRCYFVAKHRFSYIVTSQAMCTSSRIFFSRLSVILECSGKKFRQSSVIGIA